MVASPTMLVPLTEAASVVGVTPFLASTPVAQKEVVASAPPEHS